MPNDYPNIQPGGDFASLFDALRNEQDRSKGPLLSPAALLAKIPPILLPRGGMSGAQGTSSQVAGNYSGNLAGAPPGSTVFGGSRTQTQTTPFQYDSDALEAFRRIGHTPSQTPTENEQEFLRQLNDIKSMDLLKQKDAYASLNEKFSGIFASDAQVAAAAKQAGSAQPNGGGADAGGLAALLAALAGTGSVGGGSQLFPTLGGR